MIDEFLMYFNFPFVRYALVVGVLISLCSSLLGVTLVLRRLSFIGSGLSHAAFGVIAVATALSLASDMILVLPVTIICAIFLMRAGKSAKVRGDAAVAMISVGSLGVGYLVMNLFSRSSNLSGDVCTTLFGSTSILTLTQTQVWLCAALSLVVIAVFVIFYHKIFAVTFDEEFCAATGIKAQTYNTILAVIIAVIVVLAINLVGSLLISALVIFPALSAMRVFKSFKAVTICSVVVAVVCAAAGIVASILASTPVGSTIVVANIFGYLIFYLAGFFTGKVARV